MFPQRRIKLLVIVVFVVVVLFYYSGEARNIQNHGFYRSTVQAMEAKKGGNSPAGDGYVPQQPVQHDRKPEDDIARPVPPKGPPGDTEVEMEEIPIAGRTKMQVPKPKAKSDPAKQQEQGGAEEHSDAKTELNSILKRSPVIIFSKSICPYSARAKSILVNKYTILPAPYVVELDQHPIGRDLQSLLGESTGRRTVPNILVNGKSIGGGDDMAELDEKGEMASTLKKMGGKWIVEVNGA